MGMSGTHYQSLERMGNVKKILAILFVACITLSCSIGCSGDTKKKTETKPNEIVLPA
jgi:hypothetical protein